MNWQTLHGFRRWQSPHNASLPAVAAVPEPQAPGANHLEHGGELRVAGGDCHEHPEPHWHPAFGPGLADAGYWSEANIRACSWPEMPELLIATTKDWKQRKMLREKGCPRGRIPKGSMIAAGPTLPAVSPRTYTKRTEPEGQDGAQAADKARPSSVQEAGCTGGAGVRTDQGRTGVPTVYETGVGRCTE